MPDLYPPGTNPRILAIYCANGQPHVWEPIERDKLRWYACARPGCSAWLRTSKGSPDLTEVDK